MRILIGVAIGIALVILYQKYFGKGAAKTAGKKYMLLNDFTFQVTLPAVASTGKLKSLTPVAFFDFKTGDIVSGTVVGTDLVVTLEKFGHPTLTTNVPLTNLKEI